MNAVVHRGGLTIVLTFAAALMLTALPLPEWAVPWQPDWVALVLIYWCTALPERVGVIYGWSAGLLLDVLSGALLGRYAFALAIIAYISLNMHQRTRVLPMPQQALTVLMLLVLNRMMIWWIDGVTGNAYAGWVFWIAPVIGMLVWPFVFAALRAVRRHFRVS